MPQSSVLLVDDEPAIRESLGRLLTHAGWVVTTASTCAEARAALASMRPDGVILDVRMPDGGDGMSSGLEFLAVLRSQPGSETLPVIILTGYFLSTDEDAAVRRNGASVLYKPADLRMIARRLSSLCCGASGQKPPWVG
ncbi:MAG TPA: response regulator [Vicinamibacterales bacterium]|nr:response regulator [Vicinamibacterales bacterium]